MQGMQQRHLLPVSEEEQQKLAFRMGFEDRLTETAVEQFLTVMRRVQSQTSEVGKSWLQM